MGLFVLASRHRKEVEALAKFMHDLTLEMTDVRKQRDAYEGRVKILTNQKTALEQDLLLRTNERELALEAFAKTQAELEEAKSSTTLRDQIDSLTSRLNKANASLFAVFNASNVFLGQLGEYLRRKGEKMNPKHRAAFQQDFDERRRHYESTLEVNDPTSYEMVGPSDIPVTEPIAADRGQSF